MLESYHKLQLKPWTVPRRV